MKKTFLTATLLLCGILAQAKVTLPSVYTDNMVVQQKSTLKIRGKATPNADVTLNAGWSRGLVNTKADAQGMWYMEVATPKAGGPYRMVFSDGEETAIDNVLVGEVWLGSGQSNMEMPLAGWGKVFNYEEEIAKADYPKIRLFQVKKVVDTQERDRFSLEYNMGGWQECSPQTVPEFSALCYFFACRLWEELKVPVGVIDDDWGGTPCEAWVSAEALGHVMGYEGYTQITENVNSHTPAVLYNAMIHPLIDFPIKGVLWYQGCSNVGRALQHESLFQMLIQDWRQKWQQPDMPFYFAQLANFLEHKDVQPDSEWALLRESQEKALTLHNTGMACNIDIGDAKDIHPKSKRELGRRMAAIALHKTYGKKKVVYTAPIYKGYTTIGNEVHIEFDYPAGSESFVEAQDLSGFTIAGTDHKWYVAKARTEGDKIVVSCDEVKTPVAVRYGWADNPTCTLRTKSNFPLTPFRTDNWQVSRIR